MTRNRRLESPISVIAAHDWDRTLKVGDFVCLMRDGDTPHVYEVRECQSRVILEHELYNSPSLLARGFKPGDELPPLLTVRQVRHAPSYSEVPPRHTIEKKADANKVVKVTLDQIQFVMDNLNSLASTIRERNPDDDSVREG